MINNKNRGRLPKRP